VREGRRFLWFIFALLYCPLLLAQQTAVSENDSPETDFTPTVMAISRTSLKFTKAVDRFTAPPSLNPINHIGLRYAGGTGFCIDKACRFIGTNYHVLAAAQPRKVKGEKIVQTWSATGPRDKNATLNATYDGELIPFAASRDLAILELRHPLPDHHGVSFDLDELDVDQEVDIYAYPQSTFLGVPTGRSLEHFQGTYKGQTPSGLLVFKYLSFDDSSITGGASGGLVVDHKTRQVVGILYGVDRDHQESTALAVPVQSLADLVAKVQPQLATSFHSTGALSSVSIDLYPQVAPSGGAVLQHRPQASEEIESLRKRAHELSDSMRDFVAVQTFSFGVDDREASAQAAYEIRIRDGRQAYRDYPAGQKELLQIPRPHITRWIIPSDDWSHLAEMVANTLHLKINRSPAAIVDGRKLAVFQYRAGVEDEVCSIEDTTDWGLFSRKKLAWVPCWGEVWTDEQMNILRISQHSQMPWGYPIDVVVSYGLLKRSGQPLRNVPVTFSVEHQDGKHLVWCRGQFMNYQVFGASSRLLVDQQKPVPDEKRRHEE
jgi:hypothetical protein